MGAPTNGVHYSKYKKKRFIYQSIKIVYEYTDKTSLYLDLFWMLTKRYVIKCNVKDLDFGECNELQKRILINLNSV